MVMNAWNVCVWGWKGGWGVWGGVQMVCAGQVAGGRRGVGMWQVVAAEKVAHKPPSQW